MNCWECGIEPDEVHEVTGFDGRIHRQIPVWPNRDHEHALSPPTPDALADSGRAAWLRIATDHQ